MLKSRNSTSSGVNLCSNRSQVMWKPNTWPSMNGSGIGVRKMTCCDHQSNDQSGIKFITEVAGVSSLSDKVKSKQRKTAKRNQAGRAFTGIFMYPAWTGI